MSFMFTFSVNLTLCSQGLDLDNGTGYVRSYMTIQSQSFLLASRQPSTRFSNLFRLKASKLTSILKGPLENYLTHISFLYLTEWLNTELFFLILCYF